MANVWERASFQCPDGQLFDNDLEEPDCAPAESVKSCGKLLGPDTGYMAWIRQYYANNDDHSGDQVPFNPDTHADGRGSPNRNDTFADNGDYGE